MEHGRYDITLGDVPAEIVEIAQLGVPVGYIDRHMESGFVLADGTALLESEKDESGFYVGGAGMECPWMGCSCGQMSATSRSGMRTAQSQPFAV